MKKLIKLDFNNTTRERKTEDSYSELYSHDKNNGSFEFEILNDTLTTEQVIALFKFTESNKIWKTTGTVEGNKVKVTFDTTLITQNETVICYLYFDEEQRTSDTFRFKFKVKVSEIDKMSRYEVKERFINNTVIVDRLDVVTKDELKEALKNVGGIATEGLLTEVKAEELYAKKSEAVDNTNFELVKNRVLALELKTDKDTVYDDSELKGRISVLEAREDNNTIYDDTNVRERLTALESKPNVDVNNFVTKEELENKHYISDVSNLATKEELQEVRNSQPTVDTSNLVTRDELTAKNYLTEHQSLDNLVTKQELEEKHYLTTHQDLSEYAKKSELYNDSDLKARVEVLEQKTDKDTVYDDTPLKERVTALESKAIGGGAYDDKPIRDRLDVLEAKHDNDTIYDDTEVKHRLTELENKPAVDTSVFVTEEKLNSKGYLTEHQDLTPYALKSEIPQPYNDSTLNERVTALENRPTTGDGNVDTSKFVTKEELADATPATLYEIYRTDTLKETLDEHVSFINPKNVARDAGKIYLNPSSLVPKVFKGDIDNEKTVDLDVVMYSVANSLPDGYTLSDVENDINNKVLFLSNKNFAEVIPKEELKAIIKEVGGTGSTIDTSHFITEEILESKNYLTQHQPLDNLVTKEELNSKGYVTNEALNSKGYLTEEMLNSKNYLTEDVLNTKNYLTQHQDLSSLVTKQELENKHYLTEHQPLSHLVTTSDLEVLRNISVSKAELSKKVDTTDFNTFKDSVVTKTELSEYALKSELYNDTDLKNRVETLENRPNNDTAYDDTDLKRRVSELEQRPDNNIVYDDRDLRERVEALEYKVDHDNKIKLENSVNSLEKRVNDLEYKLRDYDGIDSVFATKNELNDYVKRTELPAPYDDTDLRNSLYSVDNELRNKENEFNSKFVLKDDLRTLVSEIVNQLKSENN